MTDADFLGPIFANIRAAVAQGKLNAENNAIRESFTAIEPQEIDEASPLFQDLRRINQPAHFDQRGDRNEDAERARLDARGRAAEFNRG